jgi:hypothetical protein
VVALNNYQINNINHKNCYNTLYLRNTINNSSKTLYSNNDIIPKILVKTKVYDYSNIIYIRNNSNISSNSSNNLYLKNNTNNSLSFILGDKIIEYNKIILNSSINRYNNIFDADIDKSIGLDYKDTFIYTYIKNMLNKITNFL